MDKTISIKILPRSSKNEIKRLTESSYRIKITAPPIDGAANELLIALLSDYFSIPKNRIQLLRGYRSKNKVVKILG